MRDTDDRDHLLTTVELALFLKVPPGTPRTWRYLRVGPPYLKLGPRMVRYRRRDVMTWLAQRDREMRNRPQCPPAPSWLRTERTGQTATLRFRTGSGCTLAQPVAARRSGAPDGLEEAGDGLVGDQ